GAGGGAVGGTGRVWRGQCPGRFRYPLVPSAVGIREWVGLTSRGRVQLGRAHGRGGSSGDSSFFGALQWGSGGFWEGASAPSPLLWDSFALSPFHPPTHPRGAAAMGTAFQQEAGTAGVPSKRRAAGAAAKDTRFGLTVR